VITAAHIQESSGPSFRSPERSSSPSFSSAPIGLSDKELARLRRAETLQSQHTHAEGGLDESQPESVAVSDVIPERSATMPPETPGLRSIVQTLQIEVQRLREERFDAPPSYADDGA
jgi:hypothetical protein